MKIYVIVRGEILLKAPVSQIHEEHDALVSPSRPVRRIDTLEDGSLKAAGGTSMTVDT